jgi:hypothetical protein
MYEAIRRLPATYGSQSQRSRICSANLLETKRYSLLRVDSWLRMLGIYGHFVLKKEQRKTEERTVWGFQKPEWLGSPTTYELSLTSFLNGKKKGPQIWSLASYNRVPSNSPFMVACRRGDLDMIKQHLRNGTGSIMDQTACLGRTPLLVSISCYLTLIKQC